MRITENGIQIKLRLTIRISHLLLQVYIQFYLFLEKSELYVLKSGDTN